MRVVERSLGGGVSLPLLVSELFPASFSHGFTMRGGGVSSAPYDSLNVGIRWGDAPRNVAENRRRVLEASGGRQLFVARQVHGARVLALCHADAPEAVVAEMADGLATDSAGAAVAVFVADCVPVLLADPRTGACAAVHAGWRGVIAGVVPTAVEVLSADFDAHPDDMVAALGPCIGPCCFEVGPEVAAQFERTFAGENLRDLVRTQEGAKPHVDLRGAVKTQLLAAGLPEGQVDVAAACTVCDPEGRFFSYRRDATQTGQHLGFICRLAPVGP